MSQGDDPIAWAQFRSVEACVICRPGRPDIRRLSAAVQRVTGAVKLNYEVHGNSLPHLHMHFFPRYPGDPVEGGPINPKAVRQPVYAPGEITGIRARLLEALVDPVALTLFEVP